MKKNDHIILKTFQLLVVMLVSTNTISAKASYYYSNAVTGNYETATSWSSNIPNSNGTVNQELTIVSGAVITRTNNLANNATVYVSGTFNINGNYSESSWNGIIIYTGGSVSVSGTYTASQQTTVAGTLSVTGTSSFGNSLLVNATGIVNLSSSVSAPSIDCSGKITTGGNVVLSNTLTVKNGATVEIFGNLTAASINVNKGGTLIVHGSITCTGGGGLTVNGNCIASDDINVNGLTVNSTGNLVVGGDFFSVTGWGSSPSGNGSVYILNPGATISVPGYTEIAKGNYGDITAFLTNEASNTELNTIVNNLNLLAYTWYTYASGDWTASSIWTLDATGATLVTRSKTPASTDNYVIKNGKSITIPSTATITTLYLTIETGGTLTLAAGGKMTANGNITNNGTFKLQHTYTSPSSFINNGTITGNTTIEQTLTGGRNWYIGHAMNTNTSAYFGSLPAPADMQMGSYLTASSKWSSKLASGVALSTPMQGYLVYFGSAAVSYTVTHSGALYTGNQSYALATTGDTWNLLSNPFPSYINLKTSATTWDLSNVKPTIYVRSKEAGVYKFLTFNAATNVGSTGFEDGLIAPMQAFWVKASSAGSLTIKTTARTHPASTQTLKSAEVEPNDVLRINLSNASATDETILVFRSIGSETLTDNDSEKRLESQGALPQLFSIKDSKNIAINVMPEDPTPYTIPLAMTVGEKGAGEMTINAANISSFLPNTNVYLLDIETKTVTDLRQTPQYTFSTSAVTAQNRFKLFFSQVSETEQTATATDDVIESQKPAITAYAIGAKAVVTVKDVTFSGNVQIEMFDALGKQLATTISQQQRTELPLTGSTQFVVIKVTYNGITQSFKIMKSIRKM